MYLRSFSRINYVTKAKVMSPESSFDALTENLSAGGVFVCTDYPLPVGKVVTINFNIPSVSHSSVTVESEVVRQSDKGMALQFRNLEYDSFEHLTKVIKKKPLPCWSDS